MYAKEKALAGMGLVTSLIGVLGTAYAATDLYMKTEPFVRVEFPPCAPPTGGPSLACMIPDISMPRQTETDLGNLTVTLALISMGSIAVGRVVRRERAFSAWKGELYTWLEEWDRTAMRRPEE